MIEADRVSLGVLNRFITREHFSILPIDFEQKPITIESLNELDIIVFLLLCAQQNVHLYDEDSTLHPYLFYSISHLYFVNNIAIIRLDDERYNQYPPKIILLETAKILFKAAQIEYEQHSNHLALLYEQYAIQYFQTVKTNIKNQEMNDLFIDTNNKSFFFYPQKIINKTKEENKRFIEHLIDECKKLSRHCDELKLLPEPQSPRASSPTKDETGFHIPALLSPVHIEIEEQSSLNDDSTVFVTPTLNKSRDVHVQTLDEIVSSPITTIATTEENHETSTSPLPPFVDMLFTHMNGVNQWINRFCTGHEGIQNDLSTIRDHLEKLNRATSHMIFSNVKIFQSNSDENSEDCHSSHE
ncbi:unnamed protein product [Rotaria sp. Silwood1]|nr:unnamed protein product [Rotaria sp. Silwood1]